VHIQKAVWPRSYRSLHAVVRAYTPQARGTHLAELQPTTEGRMMDDSMYPVDAVRPLARAMRSTAISWYDADHRLVEKLAEDMTVQEFIDAAEDQRDRTLRENARMMAAFMNHDGAGEQTTLGEILDRDDRLWRG
jgi:hypothetical protein